MKRKIRTPYFEIGTKNYIYGDKVLEYAKDNNIVITIETSGRQELDAGYIEEIRNGEIIFSCLDVSNAQLLEDIKVVINDIVLIEFESIDNLLLQYANTTF